jgi:hypothetical protein
MKKVGLGIAGLSIILVLAIGSGLIGQWADRVDAKALAAHEKSKTVFKTVEDKPMEAPVYTPISDWSAPVADGDGIVQYRFSRNGYHNIVESHWGSQDLRDYKNWSGIKPPVIKPVSDWSKSVNGSISRRYVRRSQPFREDRLAEETHEGVRDTEPLRTFSPNP